MTASDIAAWWGATIATLVFLWELFKWTRSGPRLAVTATPNTIEVSARRRGKTSNILVKVINRGDQATVLTHLVGYVYQDRVHHLLRRKPQSFAVVNNGMGPQLPFRIEPGGRWTGGLDEQDLLEKFSKSGYLRCGVTDSMTGKDHLVVVRLADIKEHL